MRVKEQEPWSNEIKRAGTLEQQEPWSKKIFKNRNPVGQSDKTNQR